jgi:hypothetical protein
MATRTSRAGDVVLRPLDHRPVAARGDQHAEAVLDLDEVGVEFAEQRAEHALLFEHDFGPGAPRGIAAISWMSAHRPMIDAVGLASHALLSSARPGSAAHRRR